jgi:hypothetical protein
VMEHELGGSGITLRLFSLHFSLSHPIVVTEELDNKRKEIAQFYSPSPSPLVYFSSSFEDNSSPIDATPSTTISGKELVVDSLNNLSFSSFFLLFLAMVFGFVGRNFDLDKSSRSYPTPVMQRPAAGAGNAARSLRESDPEEQRVNRREERGRLSKPAATLTNLF